MIITKTKRRFIIAKLEINTLERFKPFEIRLPANVKKVTGIAVTTSRAWEPGP
jgi:hypothetical protein